MVVNPVLFGQKIPVSHIQRGVRKVEKALFHARVNGADITRRPSYAWQWARQYQLNDKFLQDITPAPFFNRTLSQHREYAALYVENMDALLNLKTKGLSRRTHPTLYPSFVPVINTVLNNKMSRVAFEHYLKHEAWLEAQPNKGMDRLSSKTSPSVFPFVLERLSKEKLVLIGEMHHQTVAKKGVAELLVALKQKNPDRRIVLFAETMYLTPLPHEAVSPYTYYRRGVEGIEKPFLPGEEPSRAVPVANGYFGEELFEKVTAHGIEVYPVEDWVIFQRQLVKKEVATLTGVLERNRTFARVMQAQMDFIRKTDPETLFVFYGGMGHVSWVEPGSLPKFFAKENPVVIEVSEASFPYSKSLIPLVWGRNHELFSRTRASRVYFWNGKDSREWGKQVGFDYHIFFGSR